ncbi:MAG: AAA family ATPase [Solirubrobacterales bacterium]
MSTATELHPSLEEATEHQPAVRAALAAAIAAGPSHAYILVGPAGSGKRAAARAFAAELLAGGADDPEEVRRRALSDPSPHPDLAWLRPPGNQHLVEEVRTGVIGAISYRPFEGAHSVYVIEEADAMAEESQNALLKTLEEPPPYAHLLLISSEPEGLLETVRSRCQEVPFAALPRDLVERRLGERSDLPPETLAALASLADGDLGRARFLASERGLRLRELTERCCRDARAGQIEARPWTELLKLAAEVGKERGAAVEAAAAARAEELGKGRDADRLRREGVDAAKRADRRARTATIDLALALCAAWFTDLIAHAEGAGELARNIDRGAELKADAAGIEVAVARRAAERAMETRRRLTVNVNEELALDALFHRAAATLGES